MLMHPLKPLKAGDTVPLELSFKPAGTQKVSLEVKSATGGSAMTEHQHHHP